MTRPLGRLRWPEVAAGGLVVLVPVGSLEQHGPHLPLDTDTRIARELATRAAAAHPERVIVAPALSYGSSGEHADFPGTLSVGTDALTTVLVELGRSADAFDGVVFVNGHGGNLAALERASATLESEGRVVRVWSWTVEGGDAHAGHTETSLLLAIDPDTVDLDAAAPGCVRPLDVIIDDLRRHGVRAVSPNGILGDPTGAYASHGRDLLTRLTADLDRMLGRLLEDLSPRGPA